MSTRKNRVERRGTAGAFQGAWNGLERQGQNRRFIQQYQAVPLERFAGTIPLSFLGTFQALPIGTIWARWRPYD